MIEPLAATTAVHGRGRASQACSRGRASMASPTSQNVRATMQALGGFMLDMDSPGRPTMLVEYGAELVSRTIAASPAPAIAARAALGSRVRLPSA
jgi:hypothetical protein